jgi:CubicO group peptidase (beta-lactamase class C family)
VITVAWLLRFLTLLGLVLSTALPAVAAEGSIEDFIESEMSAAGVPGLAYAVVADGEVNTIATHGVSKQGGESVTVETPFQIGSISKSFTALAVMQLVEAGEVGLDTEISEYLDDFSGQLAGGITVRQLLSHTSGFTNLQGNTSHMDAIGGNNELVLRVHSLAKAGPEHELGEHWEYSNANYQILGRLVEVVSGQDYQTYVTANILEPVGMEHSFVADGEVHEGMATGHTPWFGTKRPLSEKTTHRGTAPQGGIIASAGDLALFMQMMMNGEDDVLSAEGKAQMMRPASEVSPYYGFGWYVDPETGAVWYSGLTPGFEAFAAMYPDTGDASVVLLNANGGLGFGETADLQNGVVALALGRDHESGGSAWPRASLFGSLLFAPVFYMVAMVWAWWRRDEVRAKSGAAGMFSLWFPMFTTVVAAWVLMWLTPRLFGTSLSSLALFQPDLVLLLIASALLGVLWAVFRLGVAYSGPTASNRGAEQPAG